MGFLRFLGGLFLALIGGLLLLLTFVFGIFAVAFGGASGFASAIVAGIIFFVMFIGGLYLAATGLRRNLKVEIVKNEREKIKIIICPKCNEENDASTNFCKNCGRQLKKETKQ
jgi:hypothetical protein